MSKRRRPSRPRPGGGQRPSLSVVPVVLPPGPGLDGTPPITAVHPAPPSAPVVAPDPSGAGEHQVHLLVGVIAAGQLDDHLAAITTAISERHRHRQRSLARQSAARLDVGDRVRIGPAVRPTYLRGATGVVVAWAGQRAVVALDLPTGRAIAGQVRCPALALERLGR